MIDEFGRPENLDQVPSEPKLTPEEDLEIRIKAILMSTVSFLLVALAAMLICGALSSCTTTKYVPVVEHRTDTLYKTNMQHDSIYVHDSIMVSQQGDTVRISEWHTRYVEREVHDTTYVSKTDSIPAPYPVEVKVPAELTWWQQARLHLADIVLWLLLLLAIVWGIRKLGKFS